MSEDITLTCCPGCDRESALKDDIGRLRAALEPFAEFPWLWDAHQPHPEFQIILCGDRDANVVIRVRDVLAARKALKEGK
jgi:hypothetical protein